jgi:hypothetical protein
MTPLNDSKYLKSVAPVPVWYKKLTSEDVQQDLKEFNNKIKIIAHKYFAEWQVEVPDEKHLCKSNLPKEMYNTFQEKKTFSQINSPAIGKWHAVSTNNFLNVPEPEVMLLRDIIMNDYKQALIDFYKSFDPLISLNTSFAEYSHELDESWIQFYKNGDYKVLHNHLRYGFTPKFENIWAGAYYIEDGKPDKYQPYAGKFSFRIRDYNYYINPEPGLIMIWPGDILHEVHPFYGEEERVVINFNLSTKRVIE